MHGYLYVWYLYVFSHVRNRHFGFTRDHIHNPLFIHVVCCPAGVGPPEVLQLRMSASALGSPLHSEVDSAVDQALTSIADWLG